MEEEKVNEVVEETTETPIEETAPTE